MGNYNQPKIPEYLFTLPKNALINARDFADIIGRCDARSLAAGSRKGELPKPDIKKFSGTSVHSYWYPKTVISEIKRRIESGKITQKILAS